MKLDRRFAHYFHRGSRFSSGLAGVAKAWRMGAVMVALGGVLSLSSAPIAGWPQDDEDECHFDDCLKVVAPRPTCPFEATCINAPIRDGGLSCWQHLTAMPNARLSGRFQEPRDTGPHNGIDIAVPTGTALYAAKNGVVSEKEGDLPEGDKSTPNGNFVRINNFDGTQTVYIHMLSVEVNQWAHVVAGQLIGHSNDTGDSDGPHVHITQFQRQGSGETKKGEDPQDVTLAHPHC